MPCHLYAGLVAILVFAYKPWCEVAVHACLHMMLALYAHVDVMLALHACLNVMFAFHACLDVKLKLYARLDVMLTLKCTDSSCWSGRAVLTSAEKRFLGYLNRFCEMCCMKAEALRHSSHVRKHCL